MPRYRAVFVIYGLVVMLMAALVHPAGAGTINVGGTVTFPGFSGGFIDLVGDRGFTAQGFADTFVQGLEGCTPCLPGNPLNLSSRVSTEDLLIRVTLEDTTYRVGGQLVSADQPRFTLTFTAPTLFAPPLNVAPVVALTTPVSVSGSFVHLGVVEQLGATATATIVLGRLPNCGSVGACWDSASAIYELQATPEPATLLLFGTTMAGLGVVRWVKRRRQQVP